MTMRPWYRAILLALAVLAGPALAQEQAIGPETGQPLPRWVSLKADEANARRGPSLNHRIDWVFRHRNMPLLVTAEYGHWRRVVDRDGVGGWVHYVLLSRNRTVIVDQDLLDIRRTPDPNGEILAEAHEGVIAQFKDCENGWCRITVDRYRGWVPESAIWGAGEPTHPEATAVNAAAPAE